eukprot:CAMPEP_0181371804 /NCGR_PEP_ID=MMETSP1106-20121128/14329_1 /TAXON_ID=81844 /ORGANISM="Mantoniella antarctica, Strain SL-175" /LENGTH=54 /DNA_ID=CAMNT_0023489037 /DNA_START=68 /DNA_END=228 /DNA_ORIENTATION=+
MTHPATATHANWLLLSCIGDIGSQSSPSPTANVSHDDKDSDMLLTPPRTAKRPS